MGTKPEAGDGEGDRIIKAATVVVLSLVKSIFVPQWKMVMKF